MPPTRLEPYVHVLALAGLLVAAYVSIGAATAPPPKPVHINGVTMCDPPPGVVGRSHFVRCAERWESLVVPL